MKIVVYCISKNEEKFVERCVKSAIEADEFILVDTGSTDKTVEIAKSLGVTVYDIQVKPWRFDMARNTALCLVPGDADVCISLDLDEVLMPGWRQEIERLWVPGHTTRMRYLFDWSNGVRFISDKFHSRNGFRWKHPCHEALTSDPRVEQHYVYSDKLLVQHLPDDTKSRAQYLELLKVGVHEDPQDTRNSFYYARELTFTAQWLEAIKELKRYLSLPDAKWGAERAYASRLIGESLINLGMVEEAESWFIKATQESPERRENWVDLAYYYHLVRKWEECEANAERALTIDNHAHDWPNDPGSWGFKPHDLLALSAYYLGKIEKAKYHGQKALEYSPDNERLKNNLKWYCGEK